MGAWTARRYASCSSRSREGAVTPDAATERLAVGPALPGSRPRIRPRRHPSGAAHRRSGGRLRRRQDARPRSWRSSTTLQAGESARPDARHAGRPGCRGRAAGTRGPMPTVDGGTVVIGSLPPPRGLVAVLSAGTSDAAVAAEAALTAQVFGSDGGADHRRRRGRAAPRAGRPRGVRRRRLPHRGGRHGGRAAERRRRADRACR